MFTNQSEAQERGQVGIGTLIVFIALVLVAAIAAGVLINTAGFLQSQAESTGQESTDQVSNTIQTYNAYASTDGSSPASVDEITIPIGLAPGADSVDLADVTVEVFVEGESSDYVAGVTGSSDLLESGETYEYTYGGSLSLSAGTEVEFVFTTADGAQTSVIANIPDPLNTNGDPVSL